MAGTPTNTDTVAIKALEPAFAAEVPDVDLARANSEALARVRDELDRHPLLVFRAQNPTAAELVAITRGFGEPECYDDPHPGYEDAPEIAVFSNDADRGIVARPYWHTDGLARTVPPALTVFYAAEAPARGGDTLFIDARALYDVLEREDRETLEGLVAVFPSGTRHPLVKAHPRTGRKALYANLGGTVGIVGVERASAEEIFAELHLLYDRPEVTYRHRYRRGDLLVWDNYAVAHSATEPPPPGERRLMLRTDVRPDGAA